jgi:hypothetical protein
MLHFASRITVYWTSVCRETTITSHFTLRRSDEQCLRASLVVVNPLAKRYDVAVTYFDHRIGAVSTTFCRIGPE